MPMTRIPIAAAAFAFALSAANAQETTLRVGIARALSTGATLIAIERGYFREFGIKVELEDINSSADVMAMIAQNQYQIVEGGISAGYFNAVEKNLPITLAADRTSSPLGHNIMLRPDLKDQIKDIQGLKGKVIGTNGPGSVSTYEIGKVLEAGGLTLADVEIKIIPFTQMGLALRNKALDASLLIPPFTYQVRDQGLGVMFLDADTYVRPQPTEVAVNIINTDWAKKNPQVANNYFVAYLRGVRDYCNAYHMGSTRKAIIDALVKSGTERRRSCSTIMPGSRAIPTAASTWRAHSTCRAGTAKTSSPPPMFRRSGWSTPRTSSMRSTSSGRSCWKTKTVR
jgi:NitT/TauT family transport system substrate-binding protein